MYIEMYVERPITDNWMVTMCWIKTIIISVRGNDGCWSLIDVPRQVYVRSYDANKRPCCSRWRAGTTCDGSRRSHVPLYRRRRRAAVDRAADTRRCRRWDGADARWGTVPRRRAAAASRAAGLDVSGPTGARSAPTGGRCCRAGLGEVGWAARRFRVGRWTVREMHTADPAPAPRRKNDHHSSSGFSLTAFLSMTSTSDLRINACRAIKYIKQTTWTKFGKRGVSHTGPAAWNCLPPHLQAVTETGVFRRTVKSHLFTDAFS